MQKLFRGTSAGRRHAMLMATALVGLTLMAGRAQDHLDNEAIVKMVKSGLSEGLVVTMVQNQPGAYTLNPDELAKLKAAGVSERIMAAMAAKGSPTERPASRPSNAVKVGLKTPLRLLIDEPISSKTAKPGDALRLVAAEDVVVDGRTVIAKGAPATGRITAVKKKSVATHNGSLEVAVDSVRAVDGRSVPVEGRVAAGGEGMGFGHFGKEAALDKGYAIAAVVAAETAVEVAKGQ